MLTTQQNQKVTLTTALDDDALILDQLYGYERVSEPYCYTLNLHSEQVDLSLDDIVGSNFEVEFDYDGTTKRYFGGVVGEIEQLQSVEHDKGLQARYQVKVYPHLWLLKFSRDHQIFQNQKTIDIIMSVLQEQGVSQIEDKTTSCGQNVREYCVQYGETHFDFVSRLMEEEGIFYYFVHTRNGETMILCDDSSTVKAAESHSLRQIDSTVGEPGYNEILNLSISQQVVAKKFSTADYNFETASTKLFNKVSGEGSGGMVYRYPGLYTDSGEGDTLASNRIQELEWFKKTVKGTSTTPNFAPMFSFSMTNHPRPDANDVYVLYEVTHKLDLTSEKETYFYTNDFKAFPITVTFRPPIVTPKPVIPSTQTAKVTGKSGEEIWCDEYGRIKVKFFWDQNGSEDEKSSCWIRVAQLWAGSQWGGLWTPRVGMEVVVTFLEGNPDRPLITGCVYNSDNMPPYAESEPTKSTIKSNSTKDGAGGYNELRFEDKKGSEEIYIHAQKDQNTVVEDNRTLLINKGNDTSDIMVGNRTVTLHAEPDEDGAVAGNDTLTLTKGSRAVTLNAEGDDPANHTLEITKGDNVITLTEGNFLITLDQGNQEIKITGERTISVSDTDTLKNGGDFIQKVSGDHTLKVTGDLKIKVSGGIKIEAMDNIAIKSTTGGINLKALNDISLQSETGAIKLTSMGETKIAATGNFTAQGQAVSIKGESETTVDGGPALTLKASGTAGLKAGGAATIAGASISIG